MSNDLTDLNGLKNKENNQRRYNKTQYNTNNIKIGQEFKDLTALSLAVTGKKPPTGKRNRDTFLKHLYRHIEFCPSHEKDPTIKSKRQLTILEIYDPPLEVEENRGRHGEYADLLRPMILRKPSFQGKMSTLLNELEIFKKFFDEVIQFHEYKYDKIPDNQFNLWNFIRQHGTALNVYSTMVYRQISDTIKRNLNSLQKQGCLTWNDYFMIIPDIFTVIEESADIRPKSNEIIVPQKQQRTETIEKFTRMANCVLDSSLLDTLYIYSICWNNEYSLYDYKQACLTNKGAFPIRASDRQEDALKNLSLFFRQLACSDYPKKNTLIRLSKMPDEFEFWTNPVLVNRYIKLQKKYSPILTGCTDQWKELEFYIKSNYIPTIKYLNEATLASKEYADQLTKKFILYMDKKLDKKIKLPVSERLDHTAFFLYLADFYDSQLNQCQSVIQLHKHLKELYNIPPDTENKQITC